MVDTRRHLICECGDPQYRHRRGTLSVRLPHNPDPIYPIPSCSPIANCHSPYSTYETDECPCGCTAYIPLGSNPDVVW